jgi:hypothetical protein
MKRIRVIGLALVAMLAMGVAAASAVATPSHLYEVETKALAENETKEIRSRAKTEFILKGEQEILGSKVKSETKCKTLKLNAAEHPIIIGGPVGKSAKEQIEFGECTATLGGSKCEKVVVESASTNDELVTILKPAGKNGKLGSLFTPAVGKVFTTVKFTKCGIFGTREAKVEGTSTALVLGEGVQSVVGVLSYSETEEVTEIEKQSGTKEPTGLKFSGFPATIKGEAEVELTTSQVWGAF